MPNSPPIICSRCQGLKRGGTCERCGAGKRQSQQQYDKQRGTRTERGYDNRWLRFSAQYLIEHPTCVFCLERDNRVVPATEVHHRLKLATHPHLKYEPSNLVATCRPCHSSLTAQGQ